MTLVTFSTSDLEGSRLGDVTGRFCGTAGVHRLEAYFPRGLDLRSVLFMDTVGEMGVFVWRGRDGTVGAIRR